MQTPVIVVGAGPVGVRAVEEIAARDPSVAISLYNEEPCVPYNRVQLSNYLAGQVDFSAIRNGPQLSSQASFSLHNHCKIKRIDTRRKLIERADGVTQPYTKLVLATGSHAHVPALNNTHLPGIYTLRTVADADVLKQRRLGTTVILGGGLLGLETARGMQSSGQNRVIVVDHSPSLMNRQLNKAAGDLLRNKVLSLGIEVLLGNGVKEILGQDKLTGVLLRDGRELVCDTLIFAVGIRPNVALAEVSGLKTRHGIVVNEFLRTSAEDVYAVGECAEFDKITYGIVAPGFEQARIMAENLCGGRRKYWGSVISTRLKVLDYPVFSMGRVGENEPGLPDDRITYEAAEHQVYRHLVVYHGQLIGCIALGEWSELSRVRTAIETGKRLWPWQIKRFRQTGLIWSDQSADSVVYWPDHEVVCNCSHVTRGQLGQALNAGCQSLDEISASTTAGTTCGSCVSLLAELLGGRVEPAKAFKALAFFSLLALFSGLASMVSPGIPFQQAASIEWFYDELWRDNVLKQWSGYLLLGCSLAVLSLSLRKRVKRFKAGVYHGWRIMHVCIGWLTALLLVVHTGFRFGNHLNFYLMCCFTGLLLIGAFAGLVIAAEHKLNPGLARVLRSQVLWMHILLFWPLPVLLSFHILQTYYF